MSIQQSILYALSDALPEAVRYRVAYSGGCDSHVLLHAMLELKRAGAVDEVSALHVDHGLHPDSSRWARHCESVCRALGVAFNGLSVSLPHATGESPEAAARVARYRALAGAMDAGDCLLTAHHGDDQAETLMLQLLRGAGPHGLAGIASRRPFARGTLARPFLALSRRQLHEYACFHALEWIEDSSNSDTRFDRNYLRHEVMPKLRSRWPGAAACLSRAAAHCGQAVELLDEVAGADLDSARGRLPGTLSVSALAGLSDVRLHNVLRRWIVECGLPTPHLAQLGRVRAELIGAGGDRTPRLRWPGGELRRYRDALFAGTPTSAPRHDVSLEWHPPDTLALPDGAGTLTSNRVRGAGIKASACARGLTVRFRQGGERCRLAGADQSRTLKNLFQEHGVPPWRRGSVPLLYSGERLAAVADWWVCEPFQAVGEDSGWLLRWSAPFSAELGRVRDLTSSAVLQCR